MSSPVTGAPSHPAGTTPHQSARTPDGPRGDASAGGSVITWRLARLFGRPTTLDTDAWLLPVVAFAIVGSLVLTVAGGTAMFFRTQIATADQYKFLSVVALTLLVVPLATLAAAAARLSARRRDDRLASLRLLGAPAATLRRLTLLESCALAAVGSLLGVVGYLALLPVVGLIPFLGAPIGAGALWLGIPATLGCVVGMILLAAVSSAAGLRSVEIAPLGVRTRERAPRMSPLRAVAAVVALLIALAASKLLPGAREATPIVIGLLVTFGLPLAAVNLIGPWYLGRSARRRARRADDAAGLIAARSVLESPKATWRQISGVAMTSFVAVVVAAGLSFLDTYASELDRILADDIRTGVLLTVAISFVTVACSVGVNQTAAILDRRGLYVGLDRMGMPPREMDRARSRAVLRPLVTVVLASAVAGGLIIAPLVGKALLTNPRTLLATPVVLAAGVALVWLGIRAGSPTLRRVLADGITRTE